MVWSVLLLIGVALSTAVAQKRENGILYDHTAIGIQPWYEPRPVRNNNFPNVAPHDLVQTWRYVGMDKNGGSVAIKIVCKDMLIPKAPGTNDCGKYKMTLEDGEFTKEYCGEVGPFTMISKTNEIKFEMVTGPNGGGVVDCVAQAVLVTEGRVEITTTTTTTPKPTRPAYLEIESEEVDSSEHGGEEGQKSTSCSCGWANKVSSRVVNGTVTARNEFPFAAGLTYRGTRARFCGATIITKHHALTAAHCTEDEVTENLSLLVGIHNIKNDWDGPVDEIPIERVIDHAEFDRTSLTNDIALLILEREIKFSQFVGPACLPQAAPALQLDRQYIKVIGWGANVFRGAQSDVLKKVNVRVVPPKECNYKYGSMDWENPKQICTYATMKASCQGDSGGPVMWVDPETNRYTHVGIVSFGRICGDISPSVHTSVQAYLHWINHYIRASNKPSAQTCTKVR